MSPGGSGYLMFYTKVVTLELLRSTNEIRDTVLSDNRVKASFVFLYHPRMMKTSANLTAYRREEMQNLPRDTKPQYSRADNSSPMAKTYVGTSSFAQSIF